MHVCLLLLLEVSGAISSPLPAITLHVGQCKQCTHDTIHSARDFLRARRKRQLEERVHHLEGGDVLVFIHEGTYPPMILDEPELDSGISSTQRLIYSGYNKDGESPPVCQHYFYVLCDTNVNIYMCCAM